MNFEYRRDYMRGTDYIKNVTECIERAWKTQEHKIREISFLLADAIEKRTMFSFSDARMPESSRKKSFTEPADSL